MMFLTPHPRYRAPSPTRGEGYNLQAQVPLPFSPCGRRCPEGTDEGLFKKYLYKASK